MISKQEQDQAENMINKRGLGWGVKARSLDLLDNQPLITVLETIFQTVGRMNRNEYHT